jgi:hypothetical protein
MSKPQLYDSDSFGQGWGLGCAGSLKTLIHIEHVYTNDFQKLLPVICS